MAIIHPAATSSAAVEPPHGFKTALDREIPSGIGEPFLARSGLGPWDIRHYVVERTLARADAGELGYMLAFGPAFTAQSLLLRFGP